MGVSPMKIDRISQWQPTRRTFIGTGIGMAVLPLAQSGQVGAQATPVSAGTPAPTGGDGRYLFVGDRTQTRVQVFSIPDFTLVGNIDDITFGTHGGALLLPDGRLLFADTGTNELVAIAIVNGSPQVADRVPVELGGNVSWIAASPSLSHLAVGSLQDSETTQFLNIVDLETFENTSIEFTMNEPEEITPWIAGDPLHVYVAIGGQITSHLLDDLLAGNLEPLNVVDVDLGSHGGATDATSSRIFYTTAPGTGFEVLDVANGTAEYVSQIPWDLDGFAGGRNARPRMTADG